MAFKYIKGELMKELLQDFQVIIETPVAWGEMDAFNHVNNVTYFRYFESSRIKYFEEMEYFKYIAKGIGPILASTSCRYRIPLTYPDTVSIGARVTKMSDDRFWMIYHVISHKHKKLAAEGEGVLVSFDYKENKKINIPEELKQKIISIEKNNLELV